MGTHRWKDRLYPPLVIVVVVAGVWYATTHRNDSIGPVQASATSSPAKTPTTVSADSAPAPLSMPTVEKVQGRVKFTVDTTKVKHIQKVEFYVGSQLMGAAFDEPYTVTVDAGNIKPGTHQVTAKVYTDDTTAETPPASFTSQTPIAAASSPAATPVPPTNNDVAPAPVAPEPPSTPAAYAPGIPQNVTATFDPDSTSVQVSWDAPSTGTTATSYQVWRGINGSSNLAATVSTTSFNDAGLSPGTYQYTVIAVDTDNNTSQPSAPSGSVEVPDPQPAAPAAPQSANNSNG